MTKILDGEIIPPNGIEVTSGSTDDNFDTTAAEHLMGYTLLEGMFIGLTINRSYAGMYDTPVREQRPLSIEDQQILNRQNAERNRRKLVAGYVKEKRAKNASKEEAKRNKRTAARKARNVTRRNGK